MAGVGKVVAKGKFIWSQTMCTMFVALILAKEQSMLFIYASGNKCDITELSMHFC